MRKRNAVESSTEHQTANESARPGRESAERPRGSSRPRPGTKVSVAVLFAFVLFHQTDQSLVGPLVTPIMETFHVNEAQMGAALTGSIIVGAVFYPIWGYLFDRFARAKLLALASLIWGATTWLTALAPTFPAFAATRASTGIDDSSYPGMYSLIADYFGPSRRGRAYGLISVAQPIGYLLAIVLAIGLRGLIGWRNTYLLTGLLGIVVACLIFRFVVEAPRGSTEPELADLDALPVKYKFNRRAALDLLRLPSLLLLLAQGFFGAFPWQVIIYWFFRYLEKDRGYTSGQVLTTMGAAIVALSAGYLLGGRLGDVVFARNRRGRVFIAILGVSVGMLFLAGALSLPKDDYWLFFAMLMTAALFSPFTTPNIISTVYDVSPPEVRSTALAALSLVENAGSALAPLLAGIIAVESSLREAILITTVGGWAICALILAGVAFVVPRDMERLRTLMRARAEAELSATSG